MGDGLAPGLSDQCSEEDGDEVKFSRRRGKTYSQRYTRAKKLKG